MRPIRLGIDARDAFAPEQRGVGKTLRALVRHLVPLLGDSTVNLYTNRAGTIDPSPAVRVRHIDLRGDRFEAWERLRLPAATWVDGLDLLHCPGQTAPPIVPCPFVLTVHDLIPMRIDDGWSPRAVTEFRRGLLAAVQRARRVIAVSDSSKRDLLATMPVAEDKIDVVRWGVEPAPPAPLSAATWEGLCRAHGIREPYFVGFGGEAPRKNVPRLLEALALLRREAAPDARLVLVGVPDRARVRFETRAADLGIARRVAFLGYVPDGVVTGVLARAEALVYPSLYEGFGLPILEAMAAGTPVITSDVSSMPEIAGDAALLVDPTDAGAIADAMRSCHASERLRAELRERGRRRVEQFTWARAAAETLAVYERALDAGPAGHAPHGSPGAARPGTA